MKTYRFYAKLGQSERIDVVEYLNDTPESEIEEDARAFALESLDWGFEEVGR